MRIDRSYCGNQNTWSENHPQQKLPVPDSEIRPEFWQAEMHWKNTITFRRMARSAK